MKDFIEKELKKENLNIKNIEIKIILNTKIYNIELKERFEINQYKKIIEIEKKISKKLNLNKNKIILELF